MPQTLLDNRYACGDLLGSGGMAEVYLAHDRVLDRDVALKVLGDQYARNEEFIERFRREARSAASLTHPNITSIYDRGRSEDGTYYIAMEYVSGGTLKDRILGEGSLDPAAVIESGSQIAWALGYAHEHGVIHRDIKPQNILLAETGYAKVTDFGIARAASATTTSSRSPFILGTAAYMSPEQAMGNPVDPRSDLYSLGIVLYEMLTGKLPYSGGDPLKIALKHVDEPPRSPREVNPNVPELLDALTAKLLAKDPGDRYASAVELADDLERVRSGLSGLPEKKPEVITAPLPSTGEKITVQPPAAAPMEVFGSGRRRRGRLLRTLAPLLFATILVAVLAWVLMQDPSPSETSGSEDAPAKVETAPSTVQVPDDEEMSGSEDAPAKEEAATPPAAQVPGSGQGTSGLEDASGREEAAPSTVQVPGLYYASEAESLLNGASLKLGSRGEASNDTVPTGVVVEQDPAAGTTVEEGTAVNIVVSTGPAQTVSATAQSVQSLPDNKTVEKKQKEKKEAKGKKK